MGTYLDDIDIKETRNKVLQHLHFIERQVDSTNFSDYISMREKGDILNLLQAEEFREYLMQKHINSVSLIDFLPNYTKSIIEIEQGTVQKNSSDLKMLKAIEKKDNCQESLKKEASGRDFYVQWILNGISRLPERESKLIVDKYLLKLREAVIMERYGISSSTLYRNLNEAYLSLALIWNIEVVKKVE